MKKYLVFTLLFLSSFLTISACGYSPYGEDVRYCLFSPYYFNYPQYASFYYNNHTWGFDLMREDFTDKIPFESNVIDWYNYTGKKVALDEIAYFNNKMELGDIHPNSTNGFIAFLYKNKKNKAIQYLIYAKRCESYNNIQEENSWERNEVIQKKSTANFENELMKAYQDEKELFLRRKYAFQCIRLAFYNGNGQMITDVFKKEFRNSKKDYLYYWSLYFYCRVIDSKDNFNDVAEIFANSSEKAFASQFHFVQNFDLKKALQFAKSKEQVANLYAYASARTVSRNLDNLKLIYQNKPKFKTLDFLLLREINKIEDWVYTPYYTNYSPSVEQEDFYSESEYSSITTQTLRNRSQNDRLYAQEVLDFVNQCDLSKVDNPVLWKAAKIQLLFITQHYDEGLKEIKSFERNHKGEKVYEEIEKIKALCLTARQASGKAIILKDVHAIIEKYTKDRRFLFALGRELEFRGNLLDGIAIISLADHDDYSDYSYDSNDVEWRGNRLLTTPNLDVFYNYFDYLDFVYSANYLQVLVNSIHQMPAEKKNDFIYATLLKELDYLTDMLGTKYIREEKILLALKTFQSLDEHYWQDNYNAWERGKFDEYMLFDENPFYTIKHTNSFIENKETYFVNKLSITEHLYKYMQLANNVKNNDRDYYYFLIGNCYLNMTDMGNSWMMRRFESHSTYPEEYLNESYIDNLEYRARTKTFEYYNLAYTHAKTDKFKALCLHMMNYAKRTPKVLIQIKEEYPDYYSDLSSCQDLDEYFNARR